MSGLCGLPRSEAGEVDPCPAVSSARAGPDQKCDVGGRPNELLRRRRLAPRPRGGWAEHPVQCRLASFTDHRTASPLRLRLAVVYAEQPPAASSTNAGGACSAGPSGVGLGSHAGTVASARTKLGRPEERQAERAGAADASTLPPSSRRKVKLCSTTLNSGAPPCSARAISGGSAPPPRPPHGLRRLCKQVSAAPGATPQPNKDMSTCHRWVTGCHRSVTKMSPKCHQMSPKCHQNVTRCHQMSPGVTRCHESVTECHGVSRRFLNVTKCLRAVTKCHLSVTKIMSRNVTECLKMSRNVAICHQNVTDMSQHVTICHTAVTAFHHRSQSITGSVCVTWTG